MKIELSKPFFIETLTIVGIGLIGGSLAQALKRAQCVGRIIAYDNHQEALETALSMEVVDEIHLDLIAACAEADIIILATPITKMGNIVQTIFPHLKKRAIISDVGSTKGSVIEAVSQVLGHLPACFVAAHPIAGTEKHGVEHSFASLFEQRRVLITPHIENSHDAVSTIKKMWQATGAILEEMGIKHHDQVLAATSHLPHLLAFSTVDTLANLDDRAEIFRFAASGFRDFTRISTSDPDMWTDICLQNQESLLQVLHQFQKKLNILENALHHQDRETIYQIFRRAKHARDNFYNEPEIKSK